MRDRTALFEDFEWLLECGVDAERAAKRCGCHLHTIRRHYRDEHRPLPKQLHAPTPLGWSSILMPGRRTRLQGGA